MTKNISQRFSHASTHYDALTDVQLGVARELVERFAQTKSDYASILDVGTGTGRVATLLNETYPEAHVCGIDIARGMLDQAQQLNETPCWLEADARALPFRSASFDGIVSGSAYQWVHDLKGSFQQAQRCLKPGGVFAMAMFGEKTFEEMYVAFGEAAHQSDTVYQRLPMVRDVDSALHQSQLPNIDIHVENRVVSFDNLWALLKWIKNIGANGLNTDVFLGKDFLQRADDVYRSLFPMQGGIQVSFEIIWVMARK